MILKMKQIPSYAETASKTKVVGIHVLRTAVRTFILSGTWATSWQMQFAVAEGFTWFGLVCFKKKSTFYYDLLFFQEGSSCSFYRRFERFLFFLAGKRWKIKQDPPRLSRMETRCFHLALDSERRRRRRGDEGGLANRTTWVQHSRQMAAGGGRAPGLRATRRDSEMLLARGALALGGVSGPLLGPPLMPHYRV